MAELQGVLARKMPISGYFQGSVFRPTDSELDWHLVIRGGNAAHIDTKSFEGDRLPRSYLKDHQVRTAALLNDWGVTAGFVVWFRKPNLVVFFTGHQARALEFGSSLKPEDGVLLGGGFSFDIRKLVEYGFSNGDRQLPGLASRHDNRKRRANGA